MVIQATRSVQGDMHVWTTRRRPDWDMNSWCVFYRPHTINHCIQSYFLYVVEIIDSRYRRGCCCRWRFLNGFPERIHSKSTTGR